MQDTITPITYETIVADHELGALAQEQVNAAERAEPGSAKTLVRLLARARHGAWPQYEGHWDGAEWRLYIVRQRVATKGGVAFEPGDYAIGRRLRAMGGRGEEYITLYSLRTGIDTSVWHPHAQPCESEPQSDWRTATAAGWC